MSASVGSVGPIERFVLEPHTFKHKPLSIALNILLGIGTLGLVHVGFLAKRWITHKIMAYRSAQEEKIGRIANETLPPTVSVGTRTMQLNPAINERYLRNICTFFGTLKNAIQPNEKAGEEKHPLSPVDSDFSLKILEIEADLQILMEAFSKPEFQLNPDIVQKVTTTLRDVTDARQLLQKMDLPPEDKRLRQRALYRLRILSTSLNALLIQKSSQ